MKTYWTLIVFFTLSGIYAQESAEQAFPYAYRAEGEIIATEAPRHQEVFYRVALLNTPHFNREDPALSTLKEYGALRTEYLIDRKITRILLGDFFTLEEAERCLRKVRSFGLKEAEIIRYQKGYRTGSVQELRS